MVELLSPIAQDPTWFETHWWGEPVKNFLARIDHQMHL